jgi:outer membrane protein assembly factor BamB
MDGRLYVTTVENKLIAMNATDGAPLWEYAGISEMAGLVGAASPGANHEIVVPVFTSGEITALRIENGSVAWTDNLSTVRNFGGVESLADIKAMPVMEKGIIIAISFGGRLVAIDERSGNRIWQREIGGINTPWLAGNHLFVLSLNNELIALGRETGSIRWVTKLPRSVDDDPLMFTGPMLAGGRLLCFGSDGRIIEADPVEGKIIREWDSGSDLHIPPIVAGGTLYLLSDDGILTAYR